MADNTAPPPHKETVNRKNEQVKVTRFFFPFNRTKSATEKFDMNTKADDIVYIGIILFPLHRQFNLKRRPNSNRTLNLNFPLMLLNNPIRTR